MPDKCRYSQAHARSQADYVATNGLRVSEWWLAHLDRVSRWGSRFARLSNWALGNRQMRWLLERTIGLAHNRKLPRFATRTFQQWAQRHGFSRLQRRGERQVLYFADTTVNYYDPQLGIALVRVLEHNGVGVYVPPEPLHAGMSLVSLGAVEAARKLAAYNVTQLVEAVRAGRKIVSAEPSTVLCLTRDYPQLLADDDARLIADNTIEATEYLWRLHQQGALQLDLKPVHASVGYHQPCHSRAIQVTSPPRTCCVSSAACKCSAWTKVAPAWPERMGSAKKTSAIVCALAGISPMHSAIRHCKRGNRVHRL